MTNFEPRILEIIHRATNHLATGDFAECLVHIERGIEFVDKHPQEELSPAYRGGLTFMRLCVMDAIEKQATRRMVLSVAKGANGVKN